MRTDHQLEPQTYVETASGSGSVSSSEAAYRLRHGELHAAGRFRRLVREGGMGAVLEVQGDVLGLGEGHFAIKLIKQKLLGEAEVAARFRRELASHRRLSASFQVPRLVPCLAFQEDEDPSRVFGVFPFYDEGTLEEALVQGVDASEALWILADAVEGLQSLHGLGYVHRDFHPSNILVEREGGRRRGVLGDLGVGHFLHSNTIFTETQLGADRRRQVGHRGYIDPGYRASPQADLYAVGATLYRILAGRVPAEAKGPEAAALTLPPDLARLTGSRARQIAAALLAGMTAPSASDRYASVREARVDLVTLANALQQRSSEPSVPSLSTPSFSTPLVSGRRTGRRLGWVAVVTALVISSSALTLALAPSGTSIPQSLPLQEIARPASDAADLLPTEPVQAADSLSPDPSPAHASKEKTAPPVPSPPSPLPPSPTQPGEGRLRPSPRSSQADAGSARVPPLPGDGGGWERGPGGEGLAGGVASEPLAHRAAEYGASQLPGRRDGGEGRVAALAPAAEVLRIDPLIRARRYSQALTLCRDLWARWPGDPEVAGRLALVLQVENGEAGLREARTILIDALDRFPERGDLRLALARALLQLESSSTAAQRLLAAAPASGTHSDEIEALRVTLSRRDDQSH